MRIADAGSTLTLAYDEAGQRLIKKGQHGQTVYVNKFYVVTNGATVSKHIFVGSTRLATQLVTGVQGDTVKGKGGTSTTTATATSTTATDTLNKGQAKKLASADNIAVTDTGNGKGNGKANGHNKTLSTAGKFDVHPGHDAQGSASVAGGRMPGATGIEHRSDRANEVAQNTVKNPNITGELPNGGNNGNGGGNGNTGGSTGGGKVTLERFLYFYHPDHLGSTSYVTNDVGDVYEHIQYMPFGETWVEESTKGMKTDYLFTSKELDSETGLYYYGARYYDPRTSVWQSADPILEKYIGGQHNGGVYNTLHLAMYSYAVQNPVKYVDPDGNAELYTKAGEFIKEFAPQIDKVYMWNDQSSKLENLNTSVVDFHAVSATVAGEASTTGPKEEFSGVANTIFNKAKRFKKSIKFALKNWFEGSTGLNAKKYLKNPHANTSNAMKAREETIDALLGNDPTDKRTMFEGSKLLKNKKLSNFGEKYLDTGVAHDPKTIGGTTYYKERTAEQAEKYRQSKNNE